LCIESVMIKRLLQFTAFLDSCSGPKYHAVVSVSDQKMAVVTKDEVVDIYPVSTSKFGLGSKPRSKKTPLGKMKVAEKHGGGYPSGAVFKSRKFTGEILKPDAPGRDPIVTRILWLKGMESHNRNTYSRYIYIHGTPEERNIGRPASYGCIRMTSRDVKKVYSKLAVNSRVKVVTGSLYNELRGSNIKY